MVLACAGCNNDLDKVRVSSDPVSPVLNTHGDITVTKDNLESKNSFDWTAADFGYSAAVEYVLFGKLEGSNDSVRISSANDTEMDVVNSILNSSVIELGVVAGETGVVRLYLIASISGTFPPVKSNEITLSVTTVSNFFYISMPGQYQGWNPADPPFLRSVIENGTYQGMLALTEGASGWKFAAGTWDVNWGSDPADVAVTGTNVTLSNLVSGGGDIKAVPDGFYMVTFNRDQNPVNAKMYGITAVSLIGDANGGSWGTDSDFTQDAVDPYIWTLTANLQPGEFKIRFNHDWANALGGAMNELTLTGGNLAWTGTGTVTLRLDLSLWPYRLTQN